LAEFKNPNQQGGGDKKSLIVVMIVMVTVFFGLQYFRAKTNPQTASPNAATSASQSAAPAGQQPVAQSVTPVTPSTPAASPAPAAVPTVQASAESTTTIENELYRITFTNRGAQVSTWILKKYKDSDGKPLNLVHTQAAEQFGYPLSLYTYDAALTSTLSKALYVPSATGTPLPWATQAPRWWPRRKPSPPPGRATRRYGSAQSTRTSRGSR